MRLHFRLSGALVGAIAALAIAELSCPASAQDQPAAKDTIFARKILMGAIDMNMDEIETMLAPEGKLVLSDAQEHAETISTMLMRFRLCFRRPPIRGSPARIAIPPPIRSPIPNYGRILPTSTGAPPRPRRSPGAPAAPSVPTNSGR